MFISITHMWRWALRTVDMSEYTTVPLLVIRAKGLGSFGKSEMGLVHGCRSSSALRER